MNEDLLLTAADAVVAERYKQHEKWGEQRHDLEYWLTILVEEVGEFAQAIQRERGDGKESDQGNTLEEAIHISAVAMGIVEQLIERAEGVATDESGELFDWEEGPEHGPGGGEDSEESGPYEGEGTTEAAT